MNILFEWSFWLTVVSAYPLIQLAQNRYRSVVFGLISLVGIFLLTNGLVPVLALSISVASWMAAQSMTSQNRTMRYLFALGLIISSIITYKVLQINPNVINSLLTDESFGHRVFSAFILLGLSYSGLRLISFFRSARSGKRILDPVSITGYLFPIHMLVAGPICLYKDYLEINNSSAPTNYYDFTVAVNWLTTGLFYKVVIAESIRMFGWGIYEPITTDSIFETALIFIYLFFDFAGYSLIAVGIGKLLGVPTPDNFNRPFLSTSITEFWTRWHISLGNFMRQNLYYPTQVALVRKYGVRNSEAIALFSSILTFSVVGLWHQLTVNFLIWGGFVGMVIGLEKIVRDKMVSKSAISKNPRTKLFKQLLGSTYVFIVITGSLHLIINDVL